MQWVSHSQTSSSKQRMCATEKPQLATDPNYAKPLCKTSINQCPCPEIEACNLLGGPELFRAQRGLTRGLLLRGKDARGSFLVVQVIPSQSSGTCCLTATTKCAGTFSDLLHQQKGCSWCVDRMKHVNAGPRTQVTYLKARRQELGGYLPLRSPAKAWVHACHRVIGPVRTLVVFARSLLSWSCHRMRRPIPCSTKVPISEKDTSYLVHHVVFRDEK